MSKFKKILRSVTDFIGLTTPKSAAVNIPTPEVPAAPAPTRREDTGASIIVGSDAVKNQRVSGTRRNSSRSGDTIGGLGRGSGIKI